METKFFKKVANFLKNLLTNTYTCVIISIVQKDKTKREVLIMKEILRQKLEECIEMAENCAKDFGDSFEDNIAPCATYFFAPNGKRYKLSIEQK